MTKIYQAGKTRTVNRFLIFGKKNNRWMFIFSVVKIEQIYDGKKWRFNRYILEQSTLQKE